MERRYDRRHFLVRSGSAVLLVTVSVAGCDFFSTEPKTQGNASAGGAKGKEAPMLAELVKQGKLPPVEERLPENPLVVQPNDRIGVYGGEWRTAILGTGDNAWLSRTVGYDGLTRWSVDWTRLLPNLAEEFEVSRDARSVVFRLRKGLKWSDGQPFTADDIVFAQNDVLNNAELFPAQPDNQITAEKIDEVTVRIRLPRPDALYVYRQATGLAVQEQLVNKPFHYLRQFHKKYNPDADQLARQEGFASWVELFDNKAGITNAALYWQNPDMPTLRPWKVTSPLADGGRVVLERNPYYWKVDPEGSQLPYLDRVVYEVIQDSEVILTRALNGDFNLHMRHVNNLRNKPVLAQNRERGRYRFADSLPGEMNTAIIALNLAHQDPVKRAIFNNKNFRIGLSHAINRQEIINVVYQRQGEPWQAAPRRETPYFNEQLAKQYTEYNVNLANEFLDRAGYTERRGGLRLGPNGQPIRFTVEVAADFRQDIVDAMELVVRYWREVGVDASLRTVDRALLQEHKDANRHDAVVWPGDNGLRDALLDPRWYFAFHISESMFAVPWARWYVTEGSEGEEPPAPMRRQMELYRQLLATPDEDGQYELMREILKISQEEFWVMGLNLTPPGYAIVANNFHNVPERVIDATGYNSPGPTNPEQYFIQ